MQKKVLSPIALALVTLALVGCGGGGGGGAAFPIPGAGTGAGTGTGAGGNGGGATQPPVVEIPVTPGNDATLVTSVNAATYNASSEEFAAFTLLNAERQRCGFGLLAQNTLLDTAATGHANYLLRNNIAGHFQNSSDPFFTGNSAWDRSVAAGYAPGVIMDDNTDTIGAGANVISGQGVKSVRSLLSAPYHAASLLGPNLDIGISVLSSDTAGTTGPLGPRNIAQMNLGIAQGAYSQKAHSAIVQTYPCEGTTGTAYKLTNESPNPIPGRDLLVNPVGQPVIVQVRPGNMIRISSATMVKKSDGSVVTLRPSVEYSNDAHHMMTPMTAFILPDSPLLPNTEYTVTLEGNNTLANFDGSTFTSSGTNPAITSNSTGAFTKTFSFTTGS